MTDGAVILPGLLLGFFTACLSPMILRYFSLRAHYFLSLLPLSFFIYFFAQALFLAKGQILVHSQSWVDVINIQLSFRIDGLSLLLSLLISFFGFLIILYSGNYLQRYPDLGKFYFLLIAFMTSMLGLVLSDNLIVLFLFWELTTFTSFLLIGLDHDKEEARASAWQAILVTTLGAISMMAGFILLGETSGTYSITGILEEADTIRSSELYLPILILILLGAFTKSAQFPFHFWLPGAMTAPTPISAYLHSATMVKAGIFLMARLSFVLGHTPEWFGILSFAGSMTMIVGSIMALKHDDMKLILAYLTLMALGTLTLLLGIGSVYAIKSAIIFLLGHSLYKGTLFLVVGSIDHSAGTRKVSELGGLFKKMPFTSVAASLALLSMAGLPPALGFIGKELIYKAALSYEGAGYFIVISVFVLTMSLSTGVAIHLFMKVFLGPPRSQEKNHESPSLWLPPMTLALIGIFAGLTSLWMDVSFMKSSVSVIAGKWIVEKIFHGPKLDMALALSVLSSFLGVMTYIALPAITDLLNRITSVISLVSPELIYRKMHVGLMELGVSVAQLGQRGFYHKYFSVILATSTLGILIGLLISLDSIKFPDFKNLEFYEWVLAFILVASTLFSIVVRSVIASVLSLGVLGFIIALIFVLYGAPDLALTQLLIETLTIILFALIAIKFPVKINLRFASPRTIIDLLLSGLFGVLMTVLLWSVTAEPLDSSLADYYMESSYLLAKGRNVVNVILVDFRALDTLGEISVLAISGLGFYSLLKIGRKRKGTS